MDIYEKNYISLPLYNVLDMQEKGNNRKHILTGLSQRKISTPFVISLYELIGRGTHMILKNFPTDGHQVGVTHLIRAQICPH